ncbi:hypothetical protein L596_011657 [Steinernema carpocapsae]|uniref:Uncharacterized protein n=1 Tax=Steinernema carpocapsae TaxID=34508 RepID=A0A4U5NV16_STECR|nr:hypothetical protein L596_011657 [Steinernema carpocapsae]
MLISLCLLLLLSWTLFQLLHLNRNVFLPYLKFVIFRIASLLTTPNFTSSVKSEFQLIRKLMISAHMKQL